MTKKIKHIIKISCLALAFNLAFTGNAIAVDTGIENEKPLGDSPMEETKVEIKKLSASLNAITGETNPGARLILTRGNGDGQFTLADKEGKFIFRLIGQLEQGEEISLISEKDGGKAEKKFKVNLGNNQGEKPEEPAKPEEPPIADEKPEEPTKPEEPSKPEEPPKADEKPEEPIKPGPTPGTDSTFQPTSGRRIFGDNRYTTSVDISRRAYPDGAKAVVLASGLNTADALAAGPLAVEVDGPILLAGKTLSTDVFHEITRLDPAKVYIVGGQSSVSKEIENSLVGRTIIRLAGINRYDTSVRIGQFLANNYGYGKILLTNGSNTIDALASTAYGAKYKGAILLANKDNIPSEVRDFISKSSKKSVDIIGGLNSVSQDLADSLGDYYRARVYGIDRYDTAVQCANFTFRPENPSQAVIVSGDNAKLVDALAASPFAYKNNSPILLTNGSSIEKHTEDYIKDKGIQDFYIIGGKSTIQDSVVDRMIELIK